MIIKANEIEKYMNLHNVDKVPVEVIKVEVPEMKREGAKMALQAPRTLAKRLIITRAQTGQFGGGYDRKNGLDAVRIHYLMYNSFRKSNSYIPSEWEVDVLTGADGAKVLKEYMDHSGNLEQVFRDTFAKVNPEIQEKIEAAAKLIAEAEAISEKHGIPFAPTANIMQGMPTGYVPDSFKDIFGDLKDEDNDVVYELTHTYNHEYTGWQNSSSSC